MNYLTVAFNKSDSELKEALIKEFGNDVDFFETKGFDGSEFVFVAIIPIAALTLQVIDFFKNHFADKKNTG